MAMASRRCRFRSTTTNYASASLPAHFLTRCKRRRDRRREASRHSPRLPARRRARSAAARGLHAARRGRDHPGQYLRSTCSNADQSPGVKRGGTVEIVTHSIEVRCRADAIPDRDRGRCRRARHQPFPAPERYQAAGEGARGRRAATSRWSRWCRRRVTRKKSKPRPKLPPPLPGSGRHCRRSSRGWRGGRCGCARRVPVRLLLAPLRPRLGRAEKK